MFFQVFKFVFSVIIGAILGYIFNLAHTNYQLWQAENRYRNALLNHQIQLDTTP